MVSLLYVLLVVGIRRIIPVLSLSDRSRISTSSRTTVKRHKYRFSSIFQLPKVIICNWNQNTDPGSSCPTCELTLVSCFSFETNSNCTPGSWTPTPVNTPFGLFSCYYFNNDVNNIVTANNTGYSGSYSTVWAINLPNSTFPPTNRAGLQASFVLPDGMAPNPVVVYNEINFAQPNQDRFFALQYVNTFHNEITNVSDPTRNVTNYAVVSAAVTLLDRPAPSGTAYVGVSFAFSTLSAQFVFFDISYQLNNLFGDFAGMVGTMMGLDAIKFTASLPLMFFAFKYKTISALADHYNG